MSWFNYYFRELETDNFWIDYLKLDIKDFYLIIWKKKKL